MQYVDVLTNGDFKSNEQIITGDTRSYNGNIINYVSGDIFQNINNISSKTLQRYREKIAIELPIVEQPYYFTKIENKFLYSNKILDYKTYKKSSVEIANWEKVKFKIDHGTIKLTSAQSPIFSCIKKFTWSYACCTTYKKEVSVAECVAKMEKLFEVLVKRFIGSSVTIFYTTEHNDEGTNLHNHFVVTITGSNSKNVLTQIKSAMMCTGTKVPWIQDFDVQKGDYLEYIIKHIEHYPDGWAILSNSKAEIDQLTPE